ncbi:MAG: hypothetical protein QME89_12240, partial [Actinomycetota bacterium]|nr:hypothetical protein [Actinomycetota bacterium]
MDVFQQLDRIEDLIVSSKHVPFSNSVMVNEAELFEHYRAIAESIDIPLMIHNEPPVFKVE